MRNSLAKKKIAVWSREKKSRKPGEISIFEYKAFEKSSCCMAIMRPAVLKAAGCSQTNMLLRFKLS